MIYAYTINNTLYYVPVMDQTLSLAISGPLGDGQQRRRLHSSFGPTQAGDLKEPPKRPRRGLNGLLLRIALMS